MDLHRRSCEEKERRKRSGLVLWKMVDFEMLKK